MSVPFILDDSLATVVRPAAVWWTGAHVIERPAVIDAELADVVPAVTMSPPPETQAVREMYRDALEDVVDRTIARLTRVVGGRDDGRWPA